MIIKFSSGQVFEGLTQESSIYQQHIYIEQFRFSLNLFISVWLWNKQFLLETICFWNQPVPAMKVVSLLTGTLDRAGTKDCPIRSQTLYPLHHFSLSVYNLLLNTGKFYLLLYFTPVPQISSVSAYITQLKMPNTHRISFPGVSDTHVKFYLTQTFYIMRVIISPRETKHSWFSLPPLGCVEFHCFFSSHCAAWYNVYCIRM